MLLIHLCCTRGRQSGKSFNLIELRSFFIGHFCSIIILLLLLGPAHSLAGIIIAQQWWRIYLILIFLRFFPSNLALWNEALKSGFGICMPASDVFGQPYNYTIFKPSLWSLFNAIILLPPRKSVLSLLAAAEQGKNVEKNGKMYKLLFLLFFAQCRTIYR